MDDLRPLSFTVAREGGHSALCLAANGQVLERIYDYTFSEQSLIPPCARSTAAAG